MSFIRTLNIGIDGCRAGWFAASSEGGKLFPTLEALMSVHAGARLLLIDIPIGLPSDMPRSCDAEARQLLAPLRHSSVFPVPCRQAVYTPDYRLACDLNEAILGKRFPIQTWHILPKVREADSWLRKHPEWQGRLRECHPELAFARLNNGLPMAHPKRTAAGQRDRLLLLKKYWDKSEMIFFQALKDYPRKALAPDDILDALSLALLASRPEERVSLPATPEWDTEGLQMEIVM